MPSKITVSFVILISSGLSRKDDLMSLTYLLVYLLNGKNLWLGELKPSDSNFFRKVAHIKKQLTIDELCS